MDEKIPHAHDDAPQAGASNSSSGSSLPRISVEPQAPQPAAAQQDSPQGANSQQAPFMQQGAPMSQPFSTQQPVQSTGRPAADRPVSGSPGMGQGAQASGPATGAPGSMPGQPAAANGQPAGTITRTVVKTRTKKLPVFLASLGGLVVGAVLIIALVMTGAFRIDETNVEAPVVSGATGSDNGGSGESVTQHIEIDPEDTTLSEVVAAKALPSVVSIGTESADGGGIGSGVILDTDGNILTNYHVIQGAQAIMVTVNDETSYEAELVGVDESSDLAVIRLVDAGDVNLTPIEIGDSDALAVGEWVMAIGSPFGNEQSVSTGIVSALYRSTAMRDTSGTSIYANMIQTDAAINPGNSGGALVNSEGQLIGINSIIESYSGSSSGVGFAIPVNYAIGIANQIIAGETPTHPYIGVTVTSVNPYTARSEGLDITSGANVTEVIANGPADEAGIEPGDIVTAVNGEAVSSADGLIIAAREREIGETVTLTVVRGDEELQIDVVLGSDGDVQAENQDGTTGDSSGGFMDEEEFQQYLEDLMANRP